MNGGEVIPVPRSELAALMSFALVPPIGDEGRLRRDDVVRRVWNRVCRPDTVDLT